MKKRFLLTMLFMAFAFLAKAGEGTHWTFPINTEFQATMSGELFIDGASMRNDANAQSYEIGVFYGDICLASYTPDAVPPFLGGGYVYNITMHSDYNNVEATFRIYNHLTNEEMDLICTTTFTFANQENYGTVDATFPIEFVSDTTPRYDVTVAANPTEGGTVSGGGNIKEGESCTVTATANTGYDFNCWKVGDNTVSTNASYTFTVTEAVDLVAYFDIHTYEITVTADPASYGTVTGGATYNYGATVSLVATANDGYTFVNWTKNGSQVSTNATYSFTAEDGVEGEYVAHFATRVYVVTVSANPAEGGFVTGGGNFSFGQTCKLRAVPKVGYEFVNWTKNAKGSRTLNTYNKVSSEQTDWSGEYVLVFEKSSDTAWCWSGVDGVNCYEEAPVNSGAITGNMSVTVTIEAMTGGYSILVNGGTNDGKYIYSQNNTNSLKFSDNPELNTISYDSENGCVMITSNTCIMRFNAASNQQRFRYYKSTSYSNQQPVQLYKKSAGGGGTVNFNEPEITFTINDTTEGAYVANFAAIDPLPAVPTQTHWTFNDNQQFTMNITGIMVLDAESMQNNDLVQYLEIGAFVGDECRGSYLPTAYNLPFATGYFYEMTLFSETGGEEIMFRVWDHINDVELDVSCLTVLQFQADGNLGDLTAPQEIEFVTNLTPHYNIMATADPADAGSVTGTGSYEEGTECTLVATANYGYNFSNWTKEGVEVSTNASYTFTVTEEGNYVANFTPIDYTITLVAQGNGIVEGEGTYPYKSNVIIQATPDEGHHFMKWMLDSDTTSVSRDLAYGIVVERDATYTGVFEINKYDISVVASPAAGGVVTGGGVYEHFSQCTLTATPNDRFVFENWTLEGDTTVLSTEASYTFEVVGAGNYVANFAPILAITTGIVADIYAIDTVGYVEGAGDYIRGRECTLNATPNTGYTFDGWYEADTLFTVEPSFTFRVWDDRDFVAHFILNTYEIVLEINKITLTPNTDEYGTVTYNPMATGNIYHHYDTLEIAAHPNAGHHFLSWNLNGEEVTTDSIYSFVVTDTATYVANFIKYFVIATSVNTTNDPAGEVTTDGGTVTGAGDYDEGTNCTLTATANEGYTFVNWTLAGTEVSTDAEYTFMVTAAGDYVANFQLNSYDIVVTVAPDQLPANAAGITAVGEVAGAGEYYHFTTCTLTATPSVGYHFLNWTDGEEVVETDATYSFTVTGPRNIKANFELNTYDITVTVAPDTTPAVANLNAAGSVEGAGTYNHYDDCELVATPAEGYHFVNWTEGGTEVSADAVYSFVVTGPRDLVANFELNSYDITVTVAPDTTPAVSNLTASGSVTGAGTYNHYDTCELTATPSEGYHFVNWTEAGEEVSTDSVYSFMVTEARDLVANFELNSYEITVTVAPDETPAASNLTAAGTVTGAGTYNHYDTCELTATPSEGYHFVNWTEGGVEVSTDTTYSFMVTEARDLVANFELNSYEITVTVAPDTTPAVSNLTAAGTVTGAGTYNHYDTCELTATPSEGYHFVNWTEGGTEVSTDATYSFMVTEARDLVANFELNSYEIVVAINPEETPAASNLAAAGTVTGAGTYNHYDTCELTATPSEGYHFVNWTEGGQQVSTDLVYSFMVTEARNLVANFELDSYEITVTINPADTPAASNLDAAGTVTGAGTYNHYDTCELTATPSEGYHFVNWTENGAEVSTEATYSFMVTEARDLVANFELNAYDITVTVAPDQTAAGSSLLVVGTVTGAGSYEHYATCELTATPSEGYHFVNWTEGGQQVSADATYSFMVTEARNLVANFELNSYEITATVAPDQPHVNSNLAAVGTVTGAGTYNHYDTCELTATSSEGYHFVNWTENGAEVSTDATYSFMVTEARDLVANFELDSYVITAIVNPDGYGTITGAGTYNHYDNCELTATANEGHTFVYWTEDEEEISTSATYSFMVTGARTLYAHFINRYQINATADPAEGGTVEGAGVYNEGSECTLTATPATGYHFVNWTLNGAEVSTDTVYTFTVTAAGDYVANFEINTYDITVAVAPDSTPAAGPTVAGTVTGAGTYEHFATCELSATPSEGYHFVNWTEGGTEVSTSATYSFTVEGPRDLVANFELNSYEIVVTVAPDQTPAASNLTVVGTVNGAGTYNHYDTCELTATPSEGYHFVNWTEGGQQVSTDAVYSFMVTEGRTLVANFAINSYEIAVTPNNAQYGSVSGAGTYDHYATCEVVATPATGYHFVNWTENGVEVSTTATYSFMVTEARTLVANFAINNYLITVVANPTEAGTVTGGGNYDHFSTCTLTAEPAYAWLFSNWTLNGEVVSTDPTYTFEVTGPADYVANFELGYVDITAYAVPASYGSVQGAGEYLIGTTCTLTAIPGVGNYFVRWTLNGETVSTDAEYSFEVTEAATYKAHFARIAYTISAEANPATAGTVTGTGSLFYYGTTCQLVAWANPGYRFVNWTKNGVEVSTSYIYDFTVTGSAHYVANFAVATYVVTATVDPEEGGTVTGAGTYNYGQQVTMTATAAADFRFVNWTEGDEVVSEEPTFTFAAESDRELVAHFISTVGVGEYDDLTVTLYPNPVIDRLHIEMDRPASRCEVYTVTGVMVYSQDNCGDKFEIEVSDLTIGAYIIRVVSDDVVKNLRFVKQ